MAKSTTLPFFITIALLFTACASEPNTAHYLHFTPPSDKVMRASEIFSDIQYVPLESSPTSVLGVWDYLRVIGDSIYFFIQGDMYIPNDLLVFSMDGSFAGYLADMGPGPEELHKPSSIARYQGDFYVRDIGRRIKVFDQDWHFSRSFQLEGIPGYMIDFRIQDNKMICFNGRDRPSFVTIYSMEGDSLTAFKPFTGEGIMSYNTRGDKMMEVGDAFHFFLTASDTIWSLQASEFKPAYIISTDGAHTMDELTRKAGNMYPPKFPGFLMDYKYVDILNYFEDDEYIIAKYRFSKIKGRDTYRLVNKEKQWTRDWNGWLNDINRAPMADLEILKDGKWIGFLSPLRLLEKKEQMLASGRPGLEFLHELKEDDNPVMVVYTLK
jgi:hypothetical protein